MSDLNGVPSVAVPASAIQPPATPPRKKRETLRLSESDCRATQIIPLHDQLFPGKPVAYDAEFVNHKKGDGKPYKCLRRVAVTNMAGQTILDVYVYYPREEGVRRCFDPVRSGVEPGDLLSQNGAVSVFQALQGLKKIFRERPVIMHDVGSDLNAFGLHAKEVFAESRFIDTQDIYGVVNLGKLAYRHLGKNIAASFHSPAEDAQATGQLWVKATGYDRAAEFQKYQKNGEAQYQAQEKAAEAKIAAKKVACQQKIQDAAAEKAAYEAKKAGSSERSSLPGPPSRKA